jgi:AcrR family transcriptional regulator
MSPETRPETLLLTELSQFEALGSSIRVRLLHLAGEPIAVADLAARLGIPTTRLYYHVNLLVDEGLLVAVDERRSGARTEILYQRAGRWLQPSPTLLEDVDDPRRTAEVMAGAIMNPARAELEAVLERRLALGSGPGFFSRILSSLTPSQIEEFGARIAALVDEIGMADTDAEGTAAFALTCVFVPLDPQVDTGTPVQAQDT